MSNADAYCYAKGDRIVKGYPPAWVRNDGGNLVELLSEWAEDRNRGLCGKVCSPAGEGWLEGSRLSCFAGTMTSERIPNDTLAFLQRRRSVPPWALAEPGPDSEELNAILAVAARVPDHGKLAPWRFIVFRGDARRRAGEVIAGVFQSDNPDADSARVETERKRLAHAPVVVGVVSRAAPHVKIPEWEQLLSAGAAAMNLVVAANAMGFSTSWLTEWYSYDPRTRAGLGLAEHERFVGFVHIGRATTAIEDRVRPVLADVVSHF